jgi:hypothetical protein
MFGDPVPVISESLGKLRQVDGISERRRAGRAFDDRRLVQDTHSQWHSRHQTEASTLQPYYARLPIRVMRAPRGSARINPC